MLSGTVTATNGGQPLAGAVVDVAGRQTTTDGSGHFALETPTGRLQLMVSGAGILPRVQSVTAGAVALDAITQSGGFDLGFYRQFVRNGKEHPEALEALRRWVTAPSFDVQTVDETGAAVDPVLVANVRAAIAAVTPIWTGGQFSASFGPGVPVRFVAAITGICGMAPIGPSGAYIELHYRQTNCRSVTSTAKHETGHVLGFWHTDSFGDLMFPGGLTAEPSARERYHAAIAYRRAPGNVDPDSE